MVGEKPREERLNDVAEEHGWESFESAPEVVQNNIESKVDGIDDDPFWLLRKRGDE